MKNITVEGETETVFNEMPGDITKKQSDAIFRIYSLEDSILTDRSETASGIDSELCDTRLQVIAWEAWQLLKMQGFSETGNFRAYITVPEWDSIADSAVCVCEYIQSLKQADDISQDVYEETIDFIQLALDAVRGHTSYNADQKIQYLLGNSIETVPHQTEESIEISNECVTWRRRK